MSAAEQALSDAPEALRRALARFDEALAHPGVATDQLLRDGLIQRSNSPSSGSGRRCARR